MKILFGKWNDGNIVLTETAVSFRLAYLDLGTRQAVRPYLTRTGTL